MFFASLKFSEHLVNSTIKLTTSFLKLILITKIGINIKHAHSVSQIYPYYQKFKKPNKQTQKQFYSLFLTRLEIKDILQVIMINAIRRFLCVCVPQVIVK